MKLPLIARLEQLNTAVLEQLTVVDLRSAEDYAAGHIPGAVHLDSAMLGRSEPPVNGLLPDAAGAKSLAAAIGLRTDSHILAYDNGKGTAAARLIWVLHAYGFRNISWLDGGFSAWQSAQQPVTTEQSSIAEANITLQFKAGNMVSVDALHQRLKGETQSSESAQSEHAMSENALAIMDVRSAAEFEGSDVRSARGGHVPNAQHSEWTNVFNENGFLKTDDELKAHFMSLNINTDNDVVVYCQTHQRSAVTYLVLTHLGYNNVMAIDGAWSAWGNNADVPVETGS